MNQPATPVYGWNPRGTGPGQDHDVNAASRHEAQRQAALSRALGGAPRKAKAELPPLKQPTLPADFGQRVTALDDAIYKRGIRVSRERLLSLGQQRFHELLELDRIARSWQRPVGANTDLTDWHSVEHAFGAERSLTTGIAPRSNSEVLSGVGEERERIAAIGGFSDLFKVASNADRIRVVLEFQDAFKNLVFGQSMLPRITSGRLRSRFFCGGSGPRLDAFADWLDIVEGPHFTVILSDPVGHALAWLTDEQTPLPVNLARELFSERHLSQGQLRLAKAVWQGFLLGYSEWSLWEYVGRATRQRIDVSRLEAWRRDLSQRYQRITAFHRSVKAAFVTHLGDHATFSATDYRKFIAAEVGKLQGCLSAVVALAVSDLLPDVIVARFQDKLMCTGSKDKRFSGNDARLNAIACKIGHSLKTAFPDAQKFRFEFRELQP